MAFTIADILNQWQAVGVFDYLLPFLLIFSIIFGILSASNIIGKNRGIHAIIAIVIGLLALRLDFVQRFFTEIFPRLGVALAVLISGFILMGLLVEDAHKRFWAWGFLAVGFIAWLVVLSGSFESFTWASSINFQDYLGLIVGAVLVVGVIIAIAASGGSGNQPPKQPVQFAITPWHQ